MTFVLTFDANFQWYIWNVKMINISALSVVYLAWTKSFGSVFIVPCVRLRQFGQKHQKFWLFVLGPKCCKCSFLALQYMIKANFKILGSKLQQLFLEGQYRWRGLSAWWYMRSLDRSFHCGWSNVFRLSTLSVDVRVFFFVYKVLSLTY